MTIFAATLTSLSAARLLLNHVTNFFPFSDLGVRLMIDAEHTYFQPAIDNITTELIKKYNRDYPVIFSTYQMYLKDSTDRLLVDAERAKKGNFCFAAKLVRGAYMVLERARAAEMKYDDPIHDSLRTTHDNYNAALKVLISGIAAGERVEVMIATHNKHSVELALEAMKENNLAPQSNVYFGQLLGWLHLRHQVYPLCCFLIKCNFSLKIVVNVNFQPNF
jgi:proline dehydrogenase